MAISKEDIEQGHYWVRDKADPAEGFRVVNYRHPDVYFVGTSRYETFERTFEEYDFIARIKPPENV
jgi:hypothetical protein